MNCRHARKLLQERHDDVPSSEREAALQEHLSACAPCNRLAREMDLAFEWLRALPDAQPTESFDWRLRLRLSKLDQEHDAALTLEPSPTRRIWSLQFDGFFGRSRRSAGLHRIRQRLLARRAARERGDNGAEFPGSRPRNLVHVREIDLNGITQAAP